MNKKQKKPRSVILYYKIRLLELKKTIRGFEKMKDDSSPDVNEDLAIDQEDANASSLSQEKPSRFASSGEHL